MKDRCMASHARSLLRSVAYSLIRWMDQAAWLLTHQVSITVIYQLLVDQVALVRSSFLSAPICDMGG